MRRLLKWAVVAAVVVFAAPYALAGNPHWVVDPTCTLTSSTTFTCSGKAAGLGSSPLYVVATSDGACTNQDGTHAIPGRSQTTSGPFTPQKGQFSFGPGTGNTVTATAPSCTGASQIAVVNNISLSIYECTSGTPPTFDKKGRPTNSTCTLVLGPTQAYP